LEEIIMPEEQILFPQIKAEEEQIKKDIKAMEILRKSNPTE